MELKKNNENEARFFFFFFPFFLKTGTVADKFGNKKLINTWEFFLHCLDKTTRRLHGILKMRFLKKD